jgi:hypothetical protein
VTGEGVGAQAAAATIICNMLLSASCAAAVTAGGPEFADEGFFRASFGVCNLADPSDTYAVIWQPKKPPVRSVPVTPLPGRAGCYTYLVRSSEPYLSKVAEVFGVPLRQLLLDNTDRVTALDESPVGRRLVICNPDPDVVQLVLPGGTSPARGESPGDTTPGGAPDTGSTPSAPFGGTGQPRRGTGSRTRTQPAQPSAGGPGGDDATDGAPQPAAPTPGDTDPEQPPPQQQPAEAVPTQPRRRSTRPPQQQQVWYTRKGCTCQFFQRDVMTQGRCNWYTAWGEGAPWCFTDQSDGRRCGDVTFRSYFTGGAAWDYIVGTPPPRSCVSRG